MTKEEALKLMDRLDLMERETGFCLHEGVPTANVLKDGEYYCEGNTLNVLKFIQFLRDFADRIEEMS